MSDTFLQQPPTPQAGFRLECCLARQLWELGRRIVQRLYQSREPHERTAMPSRIRLGQDEYRLNRRTPHDVFCLFGRIRLKRFIYQAVAGGAGLAPLEHALGITAGLATPALADQVGRLSAELTQQQTLDVLRQRYAVVWSVGSLRKVTAGLAAALAPLREASQIDYVANLLQQAFASRGRFRPSIVVGRDGVMMPMRPCWEEASTATLSVYDRRGKRLGTVYLGRMPQPGQAAMSDELTRLICGVLAAWDGPLPRLHYVTDAGHHPQEFFRRVLSPMKHPRTGQPLDWTWAVDYYHAAERISVLAEAIFGDGREACAWAEKMRQVLKEKLDGSSRVLQSARALRRRRGLAGSAKKFDEAASYLTKYRRFMRYAEYRRVGLAIGSGVTEAACKTLIGYRFKQSGMRWLGEQGQHVLDLRVILKSNIWSSVRSRWLDGFTPHQIANTCNKTKRTQQIPWNLALPV